MDTLTRHQKEFYERSNLIFDEAYERVQSVPPGTIMVWPGGASFKTIQSAIDSIKDASEQLEYQVLIGAGTYNEQVTTKEYIYVVGAGIGKTIINQHGMPQYAGAIQAVTNGGISQVTINSTGGKWGDHCVGILILTPGQYHIKAVNVHAAAHDNPGLNVRGISNNTGAETGFVIINNSKITAMVVNDQSTAIGIEGFMKGFDYYIDLCEISTTTLGWGISTAAASTVTVNSSTITGQYYALYNSDGASLITANGCTINGPVSDGVIVNP